MDNTIYIGVKPGESVSCVMLGDKEMGSVLSHNKNLFWCKERYTDTRLLIAKNTPEGEKISEMYKTKAPMKDLEEFLLTLTLNEMKPAMFIAIINRIKEDAAQDAVSEHQCKLLKLLGI